MKTQQQIYEVLKAAHKIGSQVTIKFTDGYKIYIILSAYDNIEIYRGTISFVRYTDDPYFPDRQYLHNTDNIISISISI